MTISDDIKARIDRAIAAATPKDVDAGHVSEEDAETPHRRRQRRPTLATALKQARKLGVPVSGATLRPDGTVSLEFGNGRAPQDVGSNEWDAEYGSGSAEVH